MRSLGLAALAAPALVAQFAQQEYEIATHGRRHGRDLRGAESPLRSVEKVPGREQVQVGGVDQVFPFGAR